MRNNPFASVGKRIGAFARFTAFTFKCIYECLGRITSGINKHLMHKGRTLVFLGFYSLFINFLLESSLRKNVLFGFVTIFKSPLAFFVNSLFIFSSFTLIFLFRRRLFVFILTSLCWYTIAGVNLYLLFVRTTPFNYTDLKLITTSLDLVDQYLSVFQMVLLSILAALLIFILVVTFIKSEKSKGLLSLAALIPIIVSLITWCSLYLYTNKVVSNKRFDNLTDSFHEHGFAYCFLYSIIDRGIEKPVNYSAEELEKTLDNIAGKHHHEFVPTMTKRNKTETSENNTPDGLFTDRLSKVITPMFEELSSHPFYNYSQSQITRISDFSKELLSTSNNEESDTFPDKFQRPNVIFLQLESFYDVTNISGYTYHDGYTNNQRAPTPIFQAMKKMLPGGKLSVPSIGAGTCNTEFEVLTGMDLTHFGLAEYPYYSFLLDSPCESIAYNAGSFGYTSHAIHNHTGNFYERHRVYPNLGFNTYTPIEVFPNISRNNYDWSKDMDLLEPILNALDSTDREDFVFAVSVQPHGKYPSEAQYSALLGNDVPLISIHGNTGNPENAGFAYYVNELMEVDLFIGYLTLALEARNEPSVLVLYGDHLPAFSIQEYWNLIDGDFYQTDYVIWNNCGLDFTDAEDFEAYQLSSYICGKLGISEGVFNQTNHEYLLTKNQDEYNETRRNLLYGYLNDTEFKANSKYYKEYKTINMVYGIKKAYIENIYIINGKTYVCGKGFNEFTKVTINGKPVDTEFLSSEAVVANIFPGFGSLIGTSQYCTQSLKLNDSANILQFSDTMVISDEEGNQILQTLYTNGTQTSKEVYADPTISYLTGEIDSLN